MAKRESWRVLSVCATKDEAARMQLAHQQSGHWERVRIEQFPPPERGQWVVSGVSLEIEKGRESHPEALGVTRPDLAQNGKGREAASPDDSTHKPARVPEATPFNRNRPVRGLSCTDYAPAGFDGHWREWHRGHGCNLDPSASEQTEG